MTPSKNPTVDPMARQAAQVARRNARKVGRYDGIANAIVITVIGCLGALALLHFLTPCEAGTLCMGVVFTPTRSGLRQMLWRLQRALHARYLRLRLAAVEMDIAITEAELASLPAQLAHHKAQAAVWALDLTSAEIDARNS